MVLNVLLLLADPQRRHVAESLPASEFHGWTLGESPRCDLVIATPEAELESLPLRRVFAHISLGPDPHADVSLDPDCEPREIALACRLLGRIVRLRRARRRDRRVKGKWKQAACTDSLTGVPNRRAWERRLKRHSSAETTWGVAIVDLDHFKSVNEQLGHPQGDRLLWRVGQELLAAVRGEDFFARLGGDEFGVLLRGVSHSQATLVCERLRERLAAAIAPATVSLGFAVGQSPRELLAAADGALREAKASGRNQVVG